jgi:hypothetical membrane protein
VSRIGRLGAFAGALAPLLFLAVTVAVSWHEEEFMEQLGSPWPSGLSLRPDGWLQIANFLVFGLLLLAFAAAVNRDAGSTRMKVARALFALAGVGAILLGFKEDPPGPEVPAFMVPDTQVLGDYVFLAVVFSPLAAFAARLFVARAPR